MSHFEYLSVAIGIIFSLSLGRLVVAIPSVFSSEKRDLLHFGHFLCLLLVQMQFWWRMWTFQSIETWDFLGFFILVAVVLLYYLAAHILVPSNHEDVQSWSDHFSKHSGWFHSTIGLAFVSGAATSYLMDDFSIPPLAIVITGLFLAATVYKQKWFHFLVLILWALLLAVITVGIQIGSA